MPPSERSNEIAAAFMRSIKTGDKANIEKFNYNEIETAISHYYRDKSTPFYKAMESRLQELKEIEIENKNNKKRQKGLLFKILTGIVVTVIGGLLLYLIIKTYF